jgi:hypothetical protein
MVHFIVVPSDHLRYTGPFLPYRSHFTLNKHHKFPVSVVDNVSLYNVKIKIVFHWHSTVGFAASVTRFEAWILCVYFVVDKHALAWLMLFVLSFLPQTSEFFLHSYLH